MTIRLVECPRSAQFLFSLLGLIALALLAIVAARRHPQLLVAIAWLILPIASNS